MTTLTCGAGQAFMSSGSNILTLFNIQSEVTHKSANFIDLPMPVSDSNAKLIFDLMGTSREITIDGIVTSADPVTSLANFASDLVGLKNMTIQTLIYGGQDNTGNGQKGYIYSSSVLGVNIQVYVQDASVTWSAGNPNSIHYSLTLYEAKGT